MVLGLVLERIYRVGIGSIVAALAGFVTLMIAHNLALGGDTMEMLRAVLDTNFWLATHVVVVTLGYASTFAAGLLAIIYIFVGVFTPLLRVPLGQRAALASAAGRDASPRRPLPGQAGRLGEASLPAKGDSITIGKALSKMVYGIVCFATLFSFVGTVLGGIWADQSWGRFWGWDPKENGALLIVLWNAIILHARWGGLGARPRHHEPRGLRQHRHQLLVVRRQHARHRPALLWLHGCRVQVAHALHGQPARGHWRRPPAAAPVAQLPQGR